MLSHVVKSELHQLMDGLLSLQKTLLLRNPETSHVIGGDGCHGDDDEEIPSDSDGSEQPGSLPGEPVEKQPDWVCVQNPMNTCTIHVCCVEL